MSPKLISRRLHAYLDYPVAAGLLILPFVLGLGAQNAMAKWLAVVIGGSALVMTFTTDHDVGVWRIWSYALHLKADRIAGAVCALAPFLLGFTGLDAWYYWINGTGVLLLCLLNNPESAARPSGANDTIAGFRAG